MLGVALAQALLFWSEARLLLVSDTEARSARKGKRAQQEIDGLAREVVAREEPVEVERELFERRLFEVGRLDDERDGRDRALCQVEKQRVSAN